MPNLDLSTVGFAGALTLAMGAAILHTLMGVDHWLPFVGLRGASGWSLRTTARATFLCGLAHCFASIGLAVVARVSFAATVTTWHEARTFLSAATLLICAGTILTRSGGSAAHGGRSLAGFWWLFVVFVLGPCEGLGEAFLQAWTRFGPAQTIVFASAFTLLTALTMTAVAAALSEALARGWVPALRRRARACAAGALAFSAAFVLAGF